MPYIPPTSANFLKRFAEFDKVDQDRVSSALDEAGRSVDSTWTEGDYATAIMFLAAHKLVTEGALNPDGVAAAAGTAGPIKAESLGDASVTYSDRGAGVYGSDAELSQTSYGAEFAKLRRRNLGPAVMVVY